MLIVVGASSSRVWLLVDKGCLASMASAEDVKKCSLEGRMLRDRTIRRPVFALLFV